MNDIMFEIGTMLQELIEYWNNSGGEHAEYYIDAYRCVQANIRSILRTSKPKVNQK